MTKTEYWKRPDVLEKHAAKRRDKYAKSPEMREAEAARVRDAYAQRTGKVRVSSSEAALEKLTGPATPALLSILMERPSYFLSRYIRDGRWPSPPQGGKYTEAQARRLLQVFSEHEKVRSTLRGDHLDTITKLHQVVHGD